MRFAVISILVAAATLPAIVDAQEQPAATTRTPAVAPVYSTEQTDIAMLLADPAAKAVLVKHIPNVVNNERISMAGSLTLRALQSYSPEMTDEVLAKIDADLAKVPVKSSAN